MRKLSVAALAFLVIGCGNPESTASDSFLKDLRKTVPSLNDVSEVDLLSYAKDVCRDPEVLTYTEFYGRGPTTQAETDGMSTVALLHCAALARE